MMWGERERVMGGETGGEMEEEKEEDDDCGLAANMSRDWLVVGTIAAPPLKLRRSSSEYSPRGIVVKQMFFSRMIEG